MSTPSRDENELAHLLFRHAAQAMAVTDSAGRILAINPAFSELTGYAGSEITAQPVSVLQSERHDREFYASIRSALRADGGWQGEVWIRRRDGESIAGWLSIRAVAAAAGDPTHFVAVHTDVGAMLSERGQLRRLAYIDTLTGLPNRALFEDRYEQVARRAVRDVTQLAVLVVSVSDAGSAAPRDELIRAVAGALGSLVRETDTLARVGAHEFAILIEDIDGPRSASMTADKLMKALEQPVATPYGEAYLEVFVGIGLYPLDGMSCSDLLAAADAAMLQASRRGHSGYAFHSTEMTAYADEQALLERQLRAAVDAESLNICFQPMFDREGRRVVGAEALLRWNDPLLGCIPPTRFVPVAEQTGLIHPLGEWAMREAFRQFVAWEAAGVAPAWISLNISSRQIDRGDFVDRVAALIAETGMAPTKIDFEFHESVLTDVAYVVPTLEALHRMGIRLSIDGFGTGFSELANLKSLPVARINVDRSFVGQIGRDATNDTLISAIVAMGRTLGMQLVAEGVETEDQARFLRAQGCDEFQGYLLGRPVSGEQFARYFGSRGDAD